MAKMTIHDIDDRLQDGLRSRAAAHGRSIEDEVREILRTAVWSGFQYSREPEESLNLATRIRSRFQEIGGVDLDIPSREPVRPPPAFDR